MGVEDDVKVVDGEKIENVANYWFCKNYYYLNCGTIILGVVHASASVTKARCHMGPKS